MEAALGEIVRLAVSLDTDSDEVRDGFPCIYAKDDPDLLIAETICIFENYPSIVNEEEVFPEFVSRNGYELVYYGQAFIDVVDAARVQLDGDSVAPYIEALNYYRANDDFIDF
ncbi:hypothetical protein [Williamsia sp. CHRR-6]|uniref:DUF7716 domain-containing protein n=1 Tax=Williamsia sp. CHRR-6 TaxID=2835871 RepID=UPI001BDAC311|nr:hypothetical protein [Williamsia sp. CHRR-6]MBT0566894.1 hypothetical protein [Williamsia sp. CHRR-6]